MTDRYSGYRADSSRSPQSQPQSYSRRMYSTESGYRSPSRTAPTGAYRTPSHDRVSARPSRASSTQVRGTSTASERNRARATQSARPTGQRTTRAARPVNAGGGRRIGSGGGGRMVSRRQFSTGVIAAAAGVVALGAGGTVWFTKRAVACEINGAQCQAPNHSSVKDLVDRGLAKPQNGNLVSVSGNVLKQGEGNRYTVKVNGADLGDQIDSYRLRAGDKLEFVKGTDKTEDHQSTKQDLPCQLVQAKGAGAIGFISNWGKNGYTEVVKGNISGETVDRGQVEEKQDRTVTYLNPKPANDEKLVAISFDDGPSPYSLQIMDILAQYNAKGTFFEIGNNLKTHLDISKKLAEAGHEVGCHSMSHPAFTGCSAEKIHEELSGCFNLLQSIGINTKVFRAPYGAFKLKQWGVVEDQISALIGWTHDTLDWDKPGVPKIVASATKNMHPGAIILCHAGGGKREQTVEALPQILKAWTDQGYKFVTIKELMASDERFPKEVSSDQVVKPTDAAQPEMPADTKADKKEASTSKGMGV